MKKLVLGAAVATLIAAAPARADITVIDPERRWTVTREALRSKSFNTPLLDHEVVGGVYRTIAAGQVVHQAPSA